MKNLNTEYPAELTALFILSSPSMYRHWKQFCWSMSNRYVDLSQDYEEALEFALQNNDVIHALAMMLISDFYKPLELLRVDVDDVIAHVYATGLARLTHEAAERALIKAIELCYGIPFRLTPDAQELGLEGRWKVYPYPLQEVNAVRLQREAVCGDVTMRVIKHADSLYVAVSLEEESEVM